MLVSTPAPIKGFLQSGQLRALASMEPSRDAVGTLPLVSDTVPGFSVSIWHGIMAPTGTPASVIIEWSQYLKDTVKREAFRQALENVDFQPAFEESGDMVQRLKTELEIWKDVIAKAQISPE